jgi:NADP-dependent 3-hydroxy acid dehydrogenase YdfG
VTEIAPGRARSKLYRDSVGLERMDAELYDGLAPIEPEDLARLLVCVLETPAHFDVTRIEAYPAAQVIAGTKVRREP